MATKRPSGPPEPIRTYGCKVQGRDQFFYDRVAFVYRWGIDRGCPTRLELFKRISDKILPGRFEWHDWTLRMIQPLCDLQWTALPGCSGASKTFNIANFATVWWLCAPEMSSVTFVSTSIKSLRRRGWAEIQKCYTSIPGPRIGNMVDSRMMWQATKGDDKHAIIGKAVEEGPTNKVADDIKGVHTRRQMVIIDEATAVPEAIFDACFNLYSYPEEFLLIVIGNPRSKLDQMGRFIEPADGWASVGVDADEWETKNQINSKPAFVARFDAEKSPNILEGRIVSKHLPTKEKVEAAKIHGQTPLYWSNFRGFPPPDGLAKTVFSETALIANDGFGKHVFSGNNFRIIGAFDPAFGGGDRPALRFAKLGEIRGGSWGIQVMPPIILPIDASSKNPVHFQLAEQLQRQCGKFIYEGYEYSCLPENLAIDATGEGGGLCDIVNRLWSFAIIKVEFGGRASEDATSLEDHRPSCEVYRNKATEMWFRSKDALHHKQLKGIDKETASELCSRMFDDSKALIKLESKDDYKKRNNGKSPDLADCLIMLLEVARRKGFRLAAQGETVHVSHNWSETIRKTQAVYSGDFEPEELETV